MNFEISARDGVHVVRLHGELDAVNTQRFVQAVTDLFTGPNSAVVLDLSDIAFLNSMGLGTLVRLVGQGNTQQTRVVLASLRPFVEGILSTTKLDRFFETFPTTDAAIAAVRPGGA
jgi:anti-anti-sigma factor